MVPSLHERRFRAMNTDIAAWVWTESPQAAAHLAEVEALFGRVEDDLSRFRPQSSLSVLNTHAGAGPQPVSGLLQTVLRQALAVARESNGIFDPTVLDAVRKAGYDRSFELIAEAPALQAAGEVSPAHCDWHSVKLDIEKGMVELPVGLGIDLGGIGKGWTVDCAAETLGAWGAALVDAGGDIRATAAPDDEPWPVAVQDPFDLSRDLWVLGLTDGAVATSSVGGRQWPRNGQMMHHLIDPRTGQPSRSDLHTVTALASSAVEAEVAAKVALILGSREGRSYLERRGLSGILIRIDHETEIVGELPLAW